MFDAGTAVVAALAAAAVLAFVAQVFRRRARHARASAALATHGASAAHQPVTLHPVINPDICIGSLSCLKACPEGDILGVVDGAARLIHGDHCIGHGKCAAECPVNAITLVFGTSTRGVDLPMVDEFFESSRPGVHIVGELGGMGLIKNAVTQGVQVAERLAQTLPKADGVTDVAIVGAGPAGVAAAISLQQAGRRVRLLEQDTMGGAVAHYPRQKVVMTEPVHLPGYGKLSKSRISKEALLAALQKAREKSGLRIEEGVRVTGIEGQDGAFRIATSTGTVEARKVVLATGRRGTPRKLGVPGEELEKVSYRLIDPQQYEGARVLVVGGGDAALEAAIQLAEQSDAEVTLSYRADTFSRVRSANRDKIEQLFKEQRVKPLLSSEVQKIGASEVLLTQKAQQLTIGNDFVIVSIGGTLPLEFLASAGVSLQRHFGQEVLPPPRRGEAKKKPEQGARTRTLLLYCGVGLGILVFLAVRGWRYYLLSQADRPDSPMHEMFKPSGPWGHGVGIVATLFMLSNFLYPVRKRTRLLAGFGSIKGWLDFHTFVGFMSPLVIAFHAAFMSNNTLATATAGSLAIVVATGLIGRFIYGLVPGAGGVALERADVLGTLERLKPRLEPLIQESDDPELLRKLFHDAPLEKRALLVALLLLPVDAVRARVRLWRARPHMQGHEGYVELRETYLRLMRLRLQAGSFDALKRLLRGWRLFHASLAVFLVFAISAHIGVSIYLGYGWHP